MYVRLPAPRVIGITWRYARAAHGRELVGRARFIDEEMARIRASIRRLADQERRLIRLFGLGQVTEEYVVREAEQVKKARLALEDEPRELQQQRQRVANLDGLSDQVRAFCAQVAERLDSFDFEEKRLALRALQVRVAVDGDGGKLTGAIPQDLATTGRTWACPSNEHISAPQSRFHRTC